MIKNTKKIKMLHLASFSGNIGDIANHEGFYKKFRKIYSVNIDQMEIRKFYKNRLEMKFDNNFLKTINKYDLLVLGGGGFFDLRWSYSYTGTTLNFSDKIIDNIEIPVLINAMGYHEYGEVEKENVYKFQSFLDKISTKKNWLITLRNDGSLNRLQNRYGNVYTNIIKVPDNGFYFNPPKYDRLNLDENSIWIGFNLTNELFNKKYNKKINIESFNDIMCKFINSFLENNKLINIILFPHTYQDVLTIAKIIGKIDHKFMRERIIIAPLIFTKNSVEYLFDLYKICSLVIAMRFHGNVCPIGMCIPTIGLAGHEQVSSLYQDLKISNHCVQVNNKKFVCELESKIFTSIKKADSIRAQYKRIQKNLNNESEKYFQRITELINQQ